MRTTPTSGAKSSCHSNAGCIATEPRILGFMTTYQYCKHL